MDYLKAVGVLARKGERRDPADCGYLAGYGCVRAIGLQRSVLYLKIELPGQGGEATEHYLVIDVVRIFIHQHRRATGHNVIFFRYRSDLQGYVRISGEGARRKRTAAAGVLFRA